MSEHLELRVDVDATPETVWAAITDWERQSEWILGTSTRVVRGDGRSVGSRIAAFTGVGPVGFTDTMEITEWDEPRRCAVLHTGPVVRGTGLFAVAPRGDAATFVWSEEVELPLGAVGRLGWPLVRPGFVWGLRRSLDRFARFCTGYTAR